MDIDKEQILVPALFLHIQKTAGTSIVKMAAQHYGNSNTASHGNFIGKTPQEFERTGFVSGHFGYNFAKPLMLGRYSFVFLRDPIDRVLSYYYFCRTRKTTEYPTYRLAQELELEEFLAAAERNEHINKAIWNSQVWCLADGPGTGVAPIDHFPPNKMLEEAIVNLNTFSYVGFTETFSEDAQIIMHELNIPRNVNPKKENITLGRPTASSLPSTTIALIQNITQLDLTLYNLAWQQRERLLGSRIIN